MFIEFFSLRMELVGLTMNLAIIGCPEEISLRKKYIDIDDFKSLIQNMDNCEYSEYLKSVFNEFQENSGIKEKGLYDLQL